MSTAINLPLSLVQILIPGTIAKIMISDSATIGYCTEFMPILGICIFPLGWLFTYRNAVQGLGNTIVPMFSGFLEVVMRLIFGFTLGKMSFRGIAYSEVSAWIAAFIMLCATYFILMKKNE